LINQLLLICSIIIIYEFLNFINFFDIIRANLKIYKNIIKLFYSKENEIDHEKLIFDYSKSLLFNSIKILLILIIIIIYILILDLFFISFLSLIISIKGMIEMCIVSIIYHFIRKKINAKL